MQGTGSGVPELWMDIGQIFAWLFAAGAVLIGGWLGLEEVRRGRRLREEERDQRNEDLRWRKAALAREILEKLEANPMAQAAMTMIDWDRQQYVLPDGSQREINYESVNKALRVDDCESLTSTEKYIRDCFDHFLSGLQHLQHYDSIDLIDFDDVAYMLAYWGRRIQARPERARAIDGYVRGFGLDGADEFLRRLHHWAEAGASRP